MSQTHILTAAGSVRCRRDIIRGFVTADEYTRLAAEKRLGTRVKTSVAHNCAFRENGVCYNFAGGKRVEAACQKRAETVSAVCRDCERRE